MCKHQTQVAEMDAVGGRRRRPTDPNGEGRGLGRPCWGGQRPFLSHHRKPESGAFPLETPVRGVNSHLHRKRGQHGEFQIQMKGPGWHKGELLASLPSGM